MIPLQRQPLPDEVEQRLIGYSADIRNCSGRKARKEKADALWDRNTTVRMKVKAPIREVLFQMATGIRECMYCGSHMATDIEHIEPRAQQPLRTFCWYNHLLACSECNGIKGQRHNDLFVRQHMLLDPTRDDPFDHLQLIVDTGKYGDKSFKGKKTIEMLRLNERQLPQARRKAWRNIKRNLIAWEDAVRRSDPEAKIRLFAEGIQDQPYADVGQAVLRQAIEPGAELFFPPELLRPLRDPRLREVALKPLPYA
ncbi:MULTISPECIES: HNH endonuclease [Streptomyces]|uniref:HNH endonuclease n=1 Tax=Streptomyces TaxID=1883 RepID=UPI0004C92194|nr:MULTISPECIES: HNH endonuclease [Streptomyces]